MGVLETQLSAKIFGHFSAINSKFRQISVITVFCFTPSGLEITLCIILERLEQAEETVITVVRQDGEIIVRLLIKAPN